MGGDTTDGSIKVFVLMFVKMDRYGIFILHI